MDDIDSETFLYEHRELVDRSRNLSALFPKMALLSMSADDETNFSGAAYNVRRVINLT